MQEQIMDSLTSLEKVLDNRHQYAQEWKRTKKGKVIGYLCTYVPEEIIYAAGALPVRILGRHQSPTIAETFIHSMYCPFSRDCLAAGLSGDFNYLDGIVIAHSCIHIRQVFDSWQRHLKPSYSHYLYMPGNVQSRYAQSCFKSELEEFKDSLEHWLGITITTEALRRAIQVYNTNRSLLQKIYELRKKEPPLISGVQAMQIVLSSMLMDKEEHNHLLEHLLEGLTKTNKTNGSKTRLMIIGSVNDDLPFLSLVESLGANVVIDDNCTGTRYFWGEVDDKGNILSAIAKRYVSKPPCPHKDFVKRQRLSHLLPLASEFRIRGAIILTQKFCDVHQYDTPIIESAFRKANIPVLSLESDVTMPLGQFRTRVEAFLEMIQLEL